MLILKLLVDEIIKAGQEAVTVFVDYNTAAFDSVSHHFLDESLAEANVPLKLVALPKPSTTLQLAQLLDFANSPATMCTLMAHKKRGLYKRSEMKFRNINGEGVKRCLKALFCISGANHDI